MCKQDLKGRTVLIVEPDIESALELQDRLADEGATVVTAYRLERALDLAKHARVAGMVINSSVFEQNVDLRSTVRERGIVHVVHWASKPVEPVVRELSALVSVSGGATRNA